MAFTGHSGFIEGLENLKTPEGREVLRKRKKFSDARYRDAIAAKAMQGLIAGSYHGREPTPHVVAKLAVEYADALIKELSK